MPLNPFALKKCLATRAWAGAVLIGCWLSSAGATAQAWLPERGEGAFSTTYGFIAVRGHYTSSGDKVPEAAANLQSVLFEVEYGLTDKIALTASVPFIAVRYNSNNPPKPFLRDLFNQTRQATSSGFYAHDFLDDGAWHPTFTDFHANLRYNLVAKPLVLTPYVELVAPSHDYAYVGESSPGRDLWEFQFGTFVGRRLDPWLPKAYAHGQVGFAIPEKSLGVRTTRMNLTMETGYLFTRKFAARGFGSFAHTFSGLLYATDFTTPEIFLTHERLLKATYWHVGGGASYALTRKTEIGADMFIPVAGRATHFGPGVSFRFTRLFERSPRPATVGTHEHP
jgi:hypothetical protein